MFPASFVPPRAALSVVAASSFILSLPNFSTAEPLHKDKLLIHYPFEEESGEVAVDASGNGNDGVIVGAPAWVEGKVGKALDLDTGADLRSNDASGQHVDMPDLVLPPELTVMCWTFRDAQTQWARLFEFSNGANVSAFWVAQENTSNNLFFRMTDTNTNAGANFDIRAPNAFTDNAWVHYAVTVTDLGIGASVMEVFQDGVSVGRRADTSRVPGAVRTANYIGRSTGNDQYLDMKIDEFRVYSIPFTESEILRVALGQEDTPPNQPPSVTLQGTDTLYLKVGETFTDPGTTVVDPEGETLTPVVTFANASLGSADLVARWSFDGDLADSTDNGLDGAHVNTDATNLEGDGIVGQSLTLDGVNQSVSVAHNALLKPADGLTISAWVKPTDFDTGGNHEIYRKNDGDDRHLLSFQSSGTILAFGVRAGATYVEMDHIIDPTDFLDGEWHLVTAVYADDLMELYIDGVSVANQVAVGTPGVPGTAVAYIGSYNGTGEYFKGSIDEVRVYSAGLTEAQVTTLWNDGKSDAFATGVDMTKPGEWLVTYTATDSAGLATSVIRRVVVQDPDSPSLTLNGDPEITLEAGADFTDLGATAKDVQDTVLEANVPGVLTTIQAWPDTSGKGNHLTPPSGVRAPALLPNGFNGKPTLVFSSGDELSRPLSDGIHSYDDFTYIAVHEFENPQPANWNTIVGIQNVDSANGLVLLQRMNNNDQIGMHYAGRNGNLRVKVDALYGPRVSVLTRSGGTGLGMDAEVTVSSNGVASTGTQTWAAEVSTSRLQVGGRQQASTTYFTGKISEVLVLGAGLSTEDRQKAEGHLAHKWGLEAELPVDHPYLANAPDQWTPADLPAVAGWYDAHSLNPGDLPGEYVLEYNYTDANGLSAEPVTRKVIVQDTTAPAVTLVGEDTIQVRTGNPYVEPGASALDAADGMLLPNSSGYIWNQVHIQGYMQSGRDEHWMNLDFNGGLLDFNPLAAPRPFTQGPAGIGFHLEGANAFQSAVPEITRTDDFQIVIRGVFRTVNSGYYRFQMDWPDDRCSFWLDLDQDGRFEKDGNAGTEWMNTSTRYGFTVLYLEAGQIYDFAMTFMEITGGERVTAYIDIPGLPRQTMNPAEPSQSGYWGIRNGVDVHTPGTYTITYSATDMAGNEGTATRTVIVGDFPTAPTITLNGGTHLRHPVGEAFIDPGVVIKDGDGSTLNGANPDIGGVFDPDQVGFYQIVYNYNDPADGPADPVVRFVEVFDNKPPSITLEGGDTLEVKLGSDFQDPGITITDNSSETLEFASSAGIPRNGLVLHVDATYLQKFYSPGDVITEWPDLSGNNRHFDNIRGEPKFSLSGINGNPSVHLARDDYIATGHHHGNRRYSVAVVGQWDGVAQGRLVSSFDNINWLLGWHNAFEHVAHLEGWASDTTQPPPITQDPHVYIATNTGGAQSHFYGDGEDLTFNTWPNGRPGRLQFGGYRATNEPASGYIAEAILYDRVLTEVERLGIDLYLNSKYGLNATAQVAPLDTGKLGTYTITYITQDSSGNIATATRTINVVPDNTVPSITLNGDALMIHEFGEAFEDPLAIAYAPDGTELQAGIAGVGTVDVNTTGVYTLTYEFTDDDGNAAPTVIREVVVEDNAGPVISLTGDAIVQVQVGEEYTDAGGTATDTKDGDVSIGFQSSKPALGFVPGLLAGGLPGNPNRNDPNDGEFGVDPLGPTFSETKAAPPWAGNFTIIYTGQIYDEDGKISFTENIDDQTYLIVNGQELLADGGWNRRTEKSVDFGAGGWFDIDLRMSNGGGGAGVASGIGFGYDPEGGTNYVLPRNSDANTADLFRFPGVDQTTVDTSEAGTYTVTLSAEDSLGNSSSVVRTVIVVEDATLPYIALNGEAEIILEAKDPYTDAGAQAYAGDGTLLEAALQGTGSVDTNAPGTYTITFNYTDGDGKVAETVSRTVTVSDTLPPVITLGEFQGQTQFVRLFQNQVYTDPGATAEDLLDGAITPIDELEDNPDALQFQTYILALNENHLFFDEETSMMNLVPNGTNIAVGKMDFPSLTSLRETYPEITQNNNFHGLWYGTFTAKKTGEYEFQITQSDDRGTIWIDLDQDGLWSRVGAKGDERLNWGNVSTRLTIEKGTYLFAMGHSQGGGGSNFRALFRTPEDAGPFDMVYIEPRSPEQAGIWNRFAAEPVDTSILGRRTIRYWAFDAAGNSAVAQRTIIVEIDKEKPVIARLGDPIIKLEAGAPYVDPGALLYDYQGNELDPTQIVATNVPSGLKAGEYIVEYNFTDAGGHVADTVTRTVRLTDTIAPVITLNGVDPVTIKTGTNYVDAGASATDIVDGNLLVSSNLTLPLNGILAWYKFDDGQGDTAKDETGNHDATLNNFNGAGWVAEGKFGGALHFNANNENNQYVLAPSFEIGGPFSVAAWVKYDAFENWSRIIDFASGAGNNNLLLANVGRGSQVHWGVRHGGAESNVRFNNYWEVGNWVHVAATVDGSNLMTLFKNGQVVGTNANGRQPLPMARTGQYIGRSHWGGDRYLRATMDELMLYSRALPESDVLQLVNGVQPIDTSAEGTHTVTYNVQDKAGNVTTATRTVIIDDTPQVPFITLVGDAEVVIDASPDAYDDPGVTVADFAGTEITNPDVQVTGTVGHAVPGTYTLVYDFTDGNGEAAASAVRKVTVEDQSAPVLTLVGSDTIEHQLGNDWVDPGINAIDFVEGEVGVASSEFTNNAILHQAYELDSVPQEIINFDQNGGLFNMQPVGSTLLTKGPRNEGLRILSDAEFRVSNPNLTRTDNFQNLFTGHFNAKTAGTYEFGMAGEDDRGTFWVDLDRDGVFETDGDNGNEWINGNYDGGRYGQVDLEQGYYKFAVGHVEYGGGSRVETRWMTISGSGPRVRSFQNPSDPLQDGFWIQYNPVDVTRRGTYTITYTASDSLGNTATATRTVIVDSNPDAPVITLNGENKVVQPFGQAFTDPGAVVKDASGTVLEANINATSGQVDHTQPGEYVLSYTYTDQSGLAAKTQRRTVTVADTTPPVITLVGDAEMDHFIGTPFTDPGASALDDFDGELRVASSELFTTDGLVLHLDPTNIPGAKDGDTVMEWLDLSPAQNHVTNTKGTPTYVADAINGRPGLSFGTSTSMAAPNDVGNAYTIFTVSMLTGPDMNGRLLASETQNWLLGYHAQRENRFHPGAWVSLSNDQPATTDPHLYIATSTGRSYKRFWNESGERTEFPAVANTAIGKFQMGAYANLGEPADGVVSEVLIYDRFLKSYERLSLQSRLAVKYGFQEINGTLPVDPSKFGSYIILYSVEDSNGNVSTVERIVNVVTDPDAPVITLTGDEVHHHEQGTPYSDPGYTLTDSGGADLGAGNVVLAGSVDPDTAGTYKFTYNFTDGNGKSAPEKVRFVIVADTAPPVITLQGDAVVKLKVGTAYDEPGFSAEDVVDGPKSATSNFEWIQNTLSMSGYMVDGRDDQMMHLEGDGQLLALDPVGTTPFTGDIVALNGDGAFRGLIPEITRNDDYQIVWQGYFLASADGDYEFGIDNADDRCSFWIDLDQDEAFEHDPAGDAGSEVVFTGYTGGGWKTYTLTAGYYRVAIAFAEWGGGAWVRPRVNLPGPVGRIPVNPGNPDYPGLWHVKQAPDFVDVNTAGTYTIDYTSTDLAGNTAVVQRTIMVVEDDTLPFISPKAGLSMNHEAGQAFADPGAIVTDQAGAELEANLQGTSTVQADTPGQYTVTYEYTHAQSGKTAVPVVMVVNVVDTTNPVITITADGSGNVNPLEFVVGDTVVDPGFTVTDNSSVNAHKWTSLDIPTNGLISIYRFDETTGTRAQDDWGGHHAELVNMDDNAHVEGRIGNGLYINGFKEDDQYVRIPSYKFGGAFSVAMWVKYESYNNWSRIFSYNNGPSNNNVLIANSTTTTNFTLSVRQGNTERRIDLVDYWNSPDWIHMATTVSDDGVFNVYKDGELAGTLSGGHAPLALTRTNHWLGKSAWDESIFQGTLDHVLIYKRVLTPVEVQALGTATPLVLDTSTDSTQTLHYYAVDNGGNLVSAQRTILIKPDPAAPTLALNGDEVFVHEAGTAFTDPGATAKDAQGATLDANVPGVQTSLVANFWQDQSGKGNSLSQPDPGFAPSLAPTGFQGKPTLRFEAGDELSNPAVDGVHSYGDFTYIAVHEFDNPQSPSWNTIVGIQEVNSANGLVLLQRMNNNNEIGMHHAGRNGNARVRVNVLYGPRVTVLSRSGGTGKGQDADVTVSSNGIVATGTQTWQAEVSTSRLQVGGRQQTSTNYFSGKISEVIVLGAGLVLEDIEKAEGYLAHKWGIESELMVDHTYKDAAPDQWTPSDLPMVAGWYDAGLITPDNTTGEFTLEYNYTDGGGKKAIPVSRTVVVEDTTPPVLTLVGEATVTIQLESDYIDAGVTVLDSMDGSILPTVSNSNPHKEYVPGLLSGGLVGNYSMGVNPGDLGIDPLGPSLTETNQKPPWKDNWTFVYTGEIYDADGVMSFREHILDKARLAVGPDFAVLNDANGGNITEKAINLGQGGWFPFELRVSNGNSTAGMNTSPGFGFDPAGGTDYVHPQNTNEDTPSLFRYLKTFHDRVDTTVEGEYTLTYTATDSSGNVGTATRTIIVQDDPTLPVLTLLGGENMDWEAGDAWEDPGYEIHDRRGDPITGSATITGSVDPTNLGLHTLHYNFELEPGKAAPQVTRKVIVVDTTPPVIELTGGEIFRVDVGGTFTDPGAVVTDNLDTGLTTEGKLQLDTSTLVAHWTFDDATGTVAREKISGLDGTLQNFTPPQPDLQWVDGKYGKAIEFDGVANYISVPATALLDLQQFTISFWMHSADFTKDMFFFEKTTDDTVNSQYNVFADEGNFHFQVTDDGGTPNKASLIVANTFTNGQWHHVAVTFDGTNQNVFIDGELLASQQPDVTTLATSPSGPSYIGAFAPGDGYFFNGTLDDLRIYNEAVPLDKVAGLQSILGIDTSKASQTPYLIYYTVTDASGNTTTVQRQVVIGNDSTPPVLQLVGDAEVTVQMGGTYSEQGASATDNEDPSQLINALITITGQVDTSVPGEYTITYAVTDTSGNVATPITRKVIVQADSTAPVLTLVGDAEITIQQGGVFNDEGATATDNVDTPAVITARITVTGADQVDVNTPGEYTLTYNVTDTAGNAATPITRKVTVTASDKFVTWVASTPLKDLAADKQDLLADPDHDRVPNLLEYALGGNPTNPDRRTSLPSAKADGASLTITFLRIKASVDPALTYKVELARKLKNGTWAEADVTVALATDQTGLPSADYERVEATSTTPIANETQGRQFLRITVER